MVDDKLMLTIIGLLVLGHILIGFVWLFYKIYKKKE